MIFESDTKLKKGFKFKTEFSKVCSDEVNNKIKLSDGKEYEFVINHLGLDGYEILFGKTVEETDQELAARIEKVKIADIKSAIAVLANYKVLCEDKEKLKEIYNSVDKKSLPVYYGHWIEAFLSNNDSREKEAFDKGFEAGKSYAKMSFNKALDKLQ